MKYVHKCTAVGDMILQRMLPWGDKGYEGFDVVRDFLAQGDFRFGNLETTIHNFECPTTQVGGGGFLCVKPEVLDVVKTFGLNVLNTANNHTLDYTHEGVVKTLEYLDKAGLAHAGSGRNLAEASEPVYLDTPSGRYAMIGVGTIYRDHEMAGEQTKDMVGRPGQNGLRFTKEYRVLPEQMKVLKEIAEQTDMNGAKNISRAEGFSPALKEGEFWFDGITFYEGDEPKRITKTNPNDMKRIINRIIEARYLSDYVAVSIHCHDLEGTKKETPDMFLKEFAHACIDAGADCVIGHGPHLLRPIEIYNGKPIFYSLGNFILMNHVINLFPYQQYERYGVDTSENLKTLYDAITANGTRGLAADATMMSAVVPYWEVEDGKLTKLQLLPFDLGFGLPDYANGWPVYDPNRGIIERLAEMSEPFGTKIVIKDGIGEVVLP